MKNNNPSLPWARRHLDRLSPYVPGKPIQEVARELGLQDIIKLASNENMLGPSPKAVKAMQLAAKDVHFYPEDTAYDLRQAMAQKLKVKPEALLFGSGSDEVLHLCAAATLGPEVECLYPLTSFVMYPILSAQMDSTGIGVALKNWTIDLHGLLDQITERTRLIFIPNPNNPTGTVVKDKDLKDFINKVPDHVLVVVDEAYRELRGKKSFDPVPLTKTHQNLIVARTFSKSYALAGVRVGYGIGHPDTIGLIARLRPPFNVNSLAQAAALAALQDEAHLEKSVALITKERDWLKAELEKLGLKVPVSEANFLMVIFEQETAPIVAGLLKQGVIVRGMAGFGAPNALRVTLASRKDNQRFLKALKSLEQ